MFKFFKDAFCDNGTPSSSRILTAVSTITVLVGFIHVCFHNHQLPDGGASAGAATLATAAYAANRATTAWQNRNQPNPPSKDDDAIAAAADVPVVVKKS